MLFLKPYKAQILTHLETFLISKQKNFSEVNSWGMDVLEKILPFCKNGKTIRGSLVLFTCELFNHKITASERNVAVALELNQAGIISHDDVIDGDIIRRGKPSIFAQYETRAHGEKLHSPRHFGNSQAICWSDICFFLCFELLHSPEIDQKILTKIIKIYATEMQYVGLAEMQDVYASYLTTPVSEKEILDLYKYKTGRYTFSVPFMIGALLAKQSDKAIPLLSNLGEMLGLMFQITDDELSIFGDEKITGKPIGTDIMRNNKTLYHHYLFMKVNQVEKEKLLTIFGNPKATKDDIAVVISHIKKYRIDEMIQDKLDTYFGDAIEILNKLSLNPKDEEKLKSLLDFCRSRSV